MCLFVDQQVNMSHNSPSMCSGVKRNKKVYITVAMDDVASVPDVICTSL